MIVLERAKSLKHGDVLCLINTSQHWKVNIKAKKQKQGSGRILIFAKGHFYILHQPK